MVTPGDQTGTVVVTVTCNTHDYASFDGDTRILYSVDPFSPEVTLITSLLLRHKPRLSPSSLLLYNHPDNQATLSIQHGSGYFTVDPVIRDMSRPPAEVNYSPKNRDIVLVPSREGRMKLEVRDLCLDVGQAEVVDVVVSGIYRVEVRVRDKVQVGKSVLACVQVLDADGQPFLPQQFKQVLRVCLVWLTLAAS